MSATGSFRRRLARAGTKLLAGVGGAIGRFPAAALAIVLLSAIANLQVEGVDFVPTDLLLRLFAALGAAAALSVAATLMAEAAGLTPAIRPLIGALAALAAGLLVGFGWNRLIYPAPLIAALVFLVPLAPHLRRSNGLRFWTFAVWSLFGAALAFLSVLLFVLGVSAILEMVRYLFGVGLGSYTYSHIYLTALTLVGPLFAMARLPADFTDEASIAAVPGDRFGEGLALLQNWVAAPLALVAGLVLHAYAAKILVTAEVPKNEIGWITVSFSVLALSLRVAIDPYLTNGGAATRLFGRFWAAMLVVPALLLAYAVGQRIAAEGVTAERYFLALACLTTLLILAAQLVPGLKRDIRVVAGVPIALLALSSVGPWGVAATVARSQTALIARDFTAGPERTIRHEGLSEEQRQVLRSRIEALSEVERVERLLPLFPKADAQALRDSSGDALRDEVLRRLGLTYGSISPTYRAFAAGKSAGFDVAGYDMVFSALGIYVTDAQSPPDPAFPALTMDGRAIVVRFGGTVDRFDFAAVVDAMPAVLFETPVQANPPYVAEVRTEGGRSLRLRITSLSYEPKTFAGIGAALDVALRRAEWPSAAAAAPAPSLGGDGN